MGLIKEKQADNLNFKNVIATLCNKKNKQDKNKSIHWKYYIGDKFDNINLEKLNNFRKNGLSDGLDNARFLRRNTLNNNLDNFKKNLLKFNYKFKDIIKNFTKNNIGNNRVYIKYKEYFIDNSQIDKMYIYMLMEKLIFKKKKIRNILEIGAGYGELSRVIMLNNNKIKYFFVDLAENLLLQIFFLNSTNKNSKIYIHKEGSLNEKIIDNYDLFFFRPDHIDEIKNIVNFDLVINTSSFMEMKKKDIHKYFSFIEKNLNISGFFYNQNRYFKDSSGDKIRFYEYPYDKNWSVKYSAQYINFRRLHTLITKRENIKKNEIKLHLKIIKKLSKNHEYPFFVPIFLMKIIRGIIQIKTYLKF